MASSFIQFRLDDTVKAKASDICTRLGLDLTTYMKMSINRLIQENGVPFSMKLEDEVVPAKESKGYEAMKKASRIAEENGISEMTLDEINAEISDSRRHGDV